jgi:hypothetical protein
VLWIGERFAIFRFGHYFTPRRTMSERESLPDGAIGEIKEVEGRQIIPMAPSESHFSVSNTTAREGGESLPTAPSESHFSVSNTTAKEGGDSLPTGPSDNYEDEVVTSDCSSNDQSDDENHDQFAAFSSRGRLAARRKNITAALDLDEDDLRALINCSNVSGKVGRF